MKTLQRIFH